MAKEIAQKRRRRSYQIGHFPVYSRRGLFYPIGGQTGRGEMGGEEGLTALLPSTTTYISSSIRCPLTR